MEAGDRLTSSEIDAIENPDERREQILIDISKYLWPDGTAAILDFAKNISDPPSYTVKTTGQEVVLQRKEFLKPPLFHEVLTGAVSRSMRRVKASDHDLKVVNRLFEVQSIRDIGDEATHAGQALVWLDDYLDNVAGNIPADGRERKKAMLEGNPILHNGSLRITGDDMVQWLKRHRSITTTMRVLGPMLRAAGCWTKSTPYTSEKGQNTSKNLWCVPDEIARDHGIKIRRSK
jgi:hypothetical protein